jgi:hypothetical protein
MGYWLLFFATFTGECTVKRIIAVTLMAVLALFAIAAPLATRSALAAPAEQGCVDGTAYIVRRGETLFRIAQRFGTTVRALAAANNIGNINLIYVGQRLIIACAHSMSSGASGVVATPVISVNTGVVPGLPVNVVPPTPVIQVNVNGLPVDCSSFRATSPTDGVSTGENTFFWNPVGNASGYIVNIYNLTTGGLVRSVRVEGTAFSTVISMNEGQTGPGFRFAWEVVALAGPIETGIPVCTSNRVVVNRAVPPTPYPTNTPVPLVP